MRFLGIILIVVFLIGVPLLMDGLKFLLQPLSLLAVILGCLGASLIAFPAKDIYRATVAFFCSKQYSKDELLLFARINRASAKFLVAAGGIVSLIGIIVEISIGTPPSASMALQSFSALVYGLFFSYFWCLPAALYFERLSN